jgi:hypothetical protein
MACDLLELVADVRRGFIDLIDACAGCLRDGNGGVESQQKIGNGFSAPSLQHRQGFAPVMSDGGAADGFDGAEHDLTARVEHRSDMTQLSGGHGIDQAAWR